MTLTHPGTLEGRLVTLEPLASEHHDGLAAAVQDGAAATSIGAGAGLIGAQAARVPRKAAHAAKA